jgi:hypothetical protein
MDGGRWEASFRLSYLSIVIIEGCAWVLLSFVFSCDRSLTCSIKVADGDDATRDKLEQFKAMNLYVNTTSYSAIPSFHTLNDELKKHEGVCL